MSNTWPNWNYTKLLVFYFVLRFPTAFSNVSSNDLPEKRHSHIGCIFFSTVCFQLSPQIPIGCICSTFLRSVFSNVSSNGLPEKRHSHIGYICLTFLHCAFSNVPSKRLHDRMQSHIGCICSTFLHCAFSNAPSSCLH